MKQKISQLLFFFLFYAACLNAQQVPGRINYQTVLRDINTDKPLANTTVALRFTVLQDDANGAQIYKEQHFGKTTNQYGLITLPIGTGDPVFGNFSQIDWNTGLKFIRVDVDITGTGNAWQTFTTTQLISVPYAFVAQSAHTLAPLGAQSGDVLKWNGTAWTPGTDISGGSYTEGQGIDISGTTIALAPQNATTGQVLKWNGNGWTPGTDITGGMPDNWGTQVAQTAATLSGNGTAAQPLSIAQQGASSGQVLKWSGTAWLPGADVGTPDNWGTQVTQTAATLSGNGTAALPLTIAQQGASNGQVLKWNGTTWLPGADVGTPDNWGTQVAQTAATLSGNGTTALPLTIAQQGAATGEVLKWNGTAWAPGTVTVVGDNWGTQVTQTTAALSGNGTAGLPLSIAQQGATNGQVLKWNGLAWTPNTDNNTGPDNWGSQVTQTSAALSGNGTAALPLSIAQQNATTGQVLRWDGAAWTPGTITGVGDNWGTQVTQTSAALSGNGTAALPLTLAQQSATTGQVLKWSGSAWLPGTDTGPDNWGTQVTQTTTVLSGNGTTGLPLSIAQQGALSGQVLKWNGSTWLPGNDNNTGGDNWGAQTVETGPSITGFGTVGNPLILAQQSATTGQVLKWNGSAWTPQTDIGGAGQWSNNGTKIYYNTNNVGINISDPLFKLHVVTGAAGGNAIVGDGSTASNNGVGVTGLSFGGSLPPGFDIGVYGSGFTGLYGSGTIGAYGTGSNGVQGISTTGEFGVYGETNGGSGFGNAVYGLGLGTNDNGIWGKADAVNGFGVYGESTTGYGVVGSSNSPSSYGVWGMNNTSTGFAGFFTGKVQVTGMLSKGGGTFKIDHPLDPQNKYLYHSFVESPDMLNIYNGNVTTDQQGVATITLPEYFEALNKDFKYQLTCLGTFAQAIVGEKIKNNQFIIRTDKPNVEVSWMVTGVRKDRFAEANRVVAEVEKTGEEKGHYLHPELFGQPAAAGIGAARVKHAPKAVTMSPVKPQTKE